MDLSKLGNMELVFTGFFQVCDWNATKTVFFFPYIFSQPKKEEDSTRIFGKAMINFLTPFLCRIWSFYDTKEIEFNKMPFFMFISCDNNAFFGNLGSIEEKKKWMDF